MIVLGIKNWKLEKLLNSSNNWIGMIFREMLILIKIEIYFLVVDKNKKNIKIEILWINFMVLIKLYQQKIFHYKLFFNYIINNFLILY